MRLNVLRWLLPTLFIPLAGFSQSDTLIIKPNSLSRKADGTVAQVNNISHRACNENTNLTFDACFSLFGSDLKQSFTKPFHLSGKDWGNLGKFALVAGAVAFADEPIQKFAVNLTGHNPGLQHVSKYVTNFGGLYEAYALAALGTYGFVFKNKKIKISTLLAMQAYLTGGAVESVAKFLSGRTRPSYYNAGTEAEPSFLGPFSKTRNGSTVSSSFPSGHTTVAFAAATVFALEYRDKPIVPVIAYSAATMIGLSRITENKHWTTDVLTGAALGFLTGKEVVNTYRRYTKLKASGQKKNTIAFNPSYSYGHFEPGLIYRFN